MVDLGLLDFTIHLCTKCSFSEWVSCSTLEQGMCLKTLKSPWIDHHIQFLLLSCQSEHHVSSHLDPWAYLHKPWKDLCMLESIRWEQLSDNLFCVCVLVVPYVNNFSGSRLNIVFPLAIQVVAPIIGFLCKWIRTLKDMTHCNNLWLCVSNV